MHRQHQTCSHIKQTEKPYSIYQPTKTPTSRLSAHAHMHTDPVSFLCHANQSLRGRVGTTQVKNKSNARTRAYRSLTPFNPSLSPCSPLSCSQPPFPFSIISHFARVLLLLFSKHLLSFFFPTPNLIPSFLSTPHRARLR